MTLIPKETLLSALKQAKKEQQKVIDASRAITYQGRPCRHCGGRERYKSNQSCINYRNCAPTPQQKLNKERAALRKKEFLR